MSSVVLPQGAWFAPNHRALTAFLSQPHAAASTAALDWDNTSCRGDVGESVFRYQLTHLVLRVGPQALEALLLSLCAGDVQLCALAREVVCCWQALCATGNLHGPFEQRLTPAHQRLRVAALLLYEALTHGPAAQRPYGIERAYGLLAQLWSGYGAEEIDHHAVRALQWAQQLGEQPLQWHCPADALGPARQVSFVPTVGAEPHMRALFACLNNAGITPWVVTASFEPLVRAAARIFDVQVSPQHIVGLRIDGGAQPQQVAAMAANHPVTYRAGKVRAIEQYLPSAPLLCAGDAMTDYEMLTMPQLHVRLLIDRGSQTPELVRLYDEASRQVQEPQNTTRPITLLQGRDASLRFVAQQRSS